MNRLRPALTNPVGAFLPEGTWPGSVGEALLQARGAIW